MSPTVEPLTGDALASALPALARLRIAVFRDWPYLYDGTLAYEEGYLRKFSSSKDAVIVAARDQGEIVGVATGSPLRDHAAEFAKPFEAAGHDIDRIFYFGESVLLPSYRGRGIGHRFFDAREAHARALDRFAHTTFCGVVRPPEHPAKPAGYRPLDAFWESRGYRRIEGLTAEFTWKDLGAEEPTAKHMQFWMRAL
ncbi:MAG TPA: GNAT family N-acetyltransferase [Hyphomicrobiaceae bacterium]|nr:GNAT family N-acetyltransferase [Hyphomicrobiaceae bacterium]